MSVELPPNGIHGVTMPKFVLPLMKAGMGVSHLVFRMLGDRMKIQGQHLLRSVRRKESNAIIHVTC